MNGFESHEHTFVDKLGSGFNVVFGDSNTGKTSLVRALLLVAYNQFDPASIRIGHTYCEVTAVTHRGRVTVRRGKGKNEWEVQPAGGEVTVFSNIGKSVLPEAADILGIRMVQLGDNLIRANVMDQLEGHFMLSEVDGNNASGSLRAQILDEISGLTGVEVLVKDIGLDKTRLSRETKKLEENCEEFQGRLHDEKDLAAENASLQLIEAFLGKAEELGRQADVMTQFTTDYIEEIQQLEVMDKALSRMPDIDTVDKCLKQVSSVQAQIQAMTECAKQYDEEEDALASIDERMKSLCVVKKVMARMSALEEKSLQLSVMKDLLDRYSESADHAESAMQQSVLISEKIKTFSADIDSLLTTIRLCPLTGDPIKPDCLKSVSTEKT